MEGPIRAAWGPDGRKFSLDRNARVPSDTSRPCSHPPVAYMVHFGELLTRQFTPDVTWTSRLEGYKHPAHGRHTLYFVCISVGDFALSTNYHLSALGFPFFVVVMCFFRNWRVTESESMKNSKHVSFFS